MVSDLRFHRPSDFKQEYGKRLLLSIDRDGWFIVFPSEMLYREMMSIVYQKLDFVPMLNVIFAVLPLNCLKIQMLHGSCFSSLFIGITSMAVAPAGPSSLFTSLRIKRERTTCCA